MAPIEEVDIAEPLMEAIPVRPITRVVDVRAVGHHDYGELRRGLDGQFGRRRPGYGWGRANDGRGLVLTLATLLACVATLMVLEGVEGDHLIARAALTHARALVSLKLLLVIAYGPAIVTVKVIQVRVFNALMMRGNVLGQVLIVGVVLITQLANHHGSKSLDKVG
jgi:uncharacterized membrane protein YgdD (TMEM256/DUF423 family)